MATVTIQQRIQAMYSKEYNLLKNSLDNALTSIPVDKDNLVKFVIQMVIPEDLWYVLKVEFRESGWNLHKEAEECNIYNISIEHKDF